MMMMRRRRRRRTKGKVREIAYTFSLCAILCMLKILKCD
jgi:hypothetical protein